MLAFLRNVGRNIIKTSKIFATVICWYWDRLQFVHLFTTMLVQKRHFCLCPFIVLCFERSQLCSFANIPIFEVLSRRNGKHISLPGISDDAVDLEAIIWWLFLNLLISAWISKHNLLPLFLLLNHFFAHAMYFWEVDHLFTICEMWHPPLSLLLIPFRVVDYGLQLVRTH